MEQLLREGMSQEEVFLILLLLLFLLLLLLLLWLRLQLLIMLLPLLQLPCQVIRMMLEGGKSEAEESEELRNKINNFISDSCVSIDDKLSMVSQNMSCPSSPDSMIQPALFVVA